MTEVGTSLHALARNRDLARLGVAWLLFVLSEYAVWIAMLVYAYAQGGASTAGAVAVAQLVPGIVLAPVLAAAADRASPVLVLVGGYLVQGLGLALTAAVLYADGPPIVAYAGAVLASTAVASTRPAQAALTPGLAHSAEELTAFNAVQGWLENAGIMVSGALTGLALATGRPGLVFAAGAASVYVAAALLVPLRSASVAAEPDDALAEPESSLLGGFRALRRSAHARLVVAIVTAEHVVIGALDLMFVVLAVSVLHRGSQWTGYLNTAYGVGGVAAAVITAALLGRRLSRPLFVAGLVLSVALAATALSRDAYLTAGLLAVVGVGRAVLDTAAHMLLQRTVSPELLGRVFGVVESLTGLGLALGSVLVPVLVGAGGASTALLGVAALIPLVLVLGGRALAGLDAAARVPVVEIALLRAMPHFRALPAPELEGLARALDRVTFADGQTIIRQGDVGDRFYAIAEGRVDVSVDGRDIGTRARPEGLGEIALVRRIPRTATVVARGPVVLYELDGEVATTIVTGHAATARRIDVVADLRLAADHPGVDVREPSGAGGAPGTRGAAYPGP